MKTLLHCLQAFNNAVKNSSHLIFHIFSLQQYLGTFFLSLEFWNFISCLDVDLLPIILLGTRRALSIWNSLSFFSSQTFLQLVLLILSCSHCSCSLLKELLFIVMNTYCCIFRTSLIFWVFFFATYTQRVTLLSFQINNSVFIHAKLLFSPSITFFLYHFLNLFWFSASFSVKL